MIIYVSHSKAFDFRSELYLPLRASSLNSQHDIRLPHENSDAASNSKAFMREECELLIAEVSYRATGLGIELGWADAFDVPIILMCRRGVKVAGSVQALQGIIIEYVNSTDLIARLEEEVSKMEM